MNNLNSPKTPNSKWDSYFYKLCNTISLRSPCLSRKIGAVIAKNNTILSTGYNGPPSGIFHCGKERALKDKNLPDLKELFPEDVISNTCPRRLMAYKSGEGLRYCLAQHAEENAVTNAAKNGVYIFNSTLYLNSIIPCQRCLGTLINAGVKEIVVTEEKFYDNYSEILCKESGIKIRSFEI